MKKVCTLVLCGIFILSMMLVGCGKSDTETKQSGSANTAVEEVSAAAELKVISTDKAPGAVGPYSQAIEVNGYVYLSGQIAIDPATGNIVEGDIKAQTEQVCKNISEILAAAGTDTSKVVKTTCFLADINDFTSFNEVYANYFTGKPARSCVAVKDIPKGALCEIEVIAVK